MNASSFPSKLVLAFWGRLAGLLTRASSRPDCLPRTPWSQWPSRPSAPRLQWRGRAGFSPASRSTYIHARQINIYRGSSRLSTKFLSNVFWGSSDPVASCRPCFTYFTNWCYYVPMRRATVTLPDDLARAVENYVQAQDAAPPLTAIVQAALRQYLTERGYLRAAGSLSITPARHGSGRRDVSQAHDRYLASR